MLLGFNRRGLYRMRQFYETYKENEFVSPLVTQISWTNHLLILSGTKTIEEKEFYIALCIKEKYSKRELERQINSAYYQRYMLSTQTLAPVEVPHGESIRFLDGYVLEFLDLPEKHSENDLKRAINGFRVGARNGSLEGSPRACAKQIPNKVEDII
jgi:hypothetical protein